MHKRHAWIMGALTAGVLLLAGCGTQHAVGGVDVQGKLLDLCGQPLPYKTVFVPGHDPVLTAEDGSFTIAGVEAPYDLVISNAYLMPEGAQEVPVLVYKGLTKPDPVVWASDPSRPRNDSCAYASASGAITPTQTSDDFRNGAALMVGPYVNGDVFAYDADPSYDLGLYFNPDLAGEGNATLFAIQWQRNTATDDATAFLAAKKLTVSLSDGTALDQDLELAEIGSRTLDVHVQLPGVMSLDGVGHHVTVDGVALPFQTARMDSGEASADGGFTVVGPVGEGLGSLILADADYGGGFGLGSGYGALDLTNSYGYAMVWRQAEADTSDVNLSFPDPVVPIMPLNGATISLDTPFRWAGPEGALYDVMFIVDQSGPDLSIEVITAEPQLQLPDLSGMGLLLDNAYRGYWLIAAMGGEAVPDDVDDLAAASADATLVPFYLEYGAPRGSAGYFFFVDAGEFRFPIDGTIK